MSGGGTAERGSTGTDFSYLRPCLNGGLAGGGLAGVIRSERCMLGDQHRAQLMADGQSSTRVQI